ncbi:cupin domain-containing protein [Cronobacter muytjensii]|uniref:cupin domain-containing protein n=1 Tax=Cronobacter muytjensii TaxID=413501 RepID=UPI0029FCD498|nr:cupin [Cronobacter muytjensii]
MNLLLNFPNAAQRREAETFETLIERPALRVERIVSTGQASPPGFWYCQAQGEWLALIAGRAALRFEDGEEVTLHPGDCLNIRARRKHRVEWTDATAPTVWLAVFYDEA